jgi:hypothetical protein
MTTAILLIAVIGLIGGMALTRRRGIENALSRARRDNRRAQQIEYRNKLGVHPVPFRRKSRRTPDNKKWK